MADISRWQHQDFDPAKLPPEHDRKSTTSYAFKRPLMFDAS
jgi:hypothetical protein